MATRMQQRRGTAAQWTAANPVLAAGELGYETDTNEFRIGDGVNTWSSLSPFKNLEDLGGSLDDYILVTTKGEPDGVASLDGNGFIPVSQLPDSAALDAEVSSVVAAAVSNKQGTLSTGTGINISESNVISVNTQTIQAKVSGVSDVEISYLYGATSEIQSQLNSSSSTFDAHQLDTTNVHGIADTAELATKTYADAVGTTAAAALVAHKSDTTNVHGIADTAELATKTYATDAADAVGATAATDLSTHQSDTTNVHGIADTAELATKTYATDAAGDVGATAAAALAVHESDSTSVHGIANTAELATKTYATDAADAVGATAATDLSTHQSDTTNVHGISDTSALALTATVNSALNLKASLASPTFTGTVAGITKTMVGLGSVDNTEDSAKPVSTATQTALDLKAPLASPALTGVPTAPTATAGTATTQVATTQFVGTAVSNLVASSPAALDTLNELATALGNDANFSTTVTNNLAAKAPLASPALTGTATVVNLTASGTVTLPAAGIVFSDGTQAAEGVPSRTTIIQKTGSYTLSALTERDDLIEMGSGSGMTLTIPTDATLNFPIGTSLDILQTSTGQVTFAGAAGVTVNATPGLKLRTTWSSATLFKRAANTWVVYGDLTA